MCILVIQPGSLLSITNCIRSLTAYDGSSEPQKHAIDLRRRSHRQLSCYRRHPLCATHIYCHLLSADNDRSRKHSLDAGEHDTPDIHLRFGEAFKMSCMHLKQQRGICGCYAAAVHGQTLKMTKEAQRRECGAEKPCCGNLQIILYLASARKKIIELELDFSCH